MAVVTAIPTSARGESGPAIFFFMAGLGICTANGTPMHDRNAAERHWERILELFPATLS